MVETQPPREKEEISPKLITIKGIINNPRMVGAMSFAKNRANNIVTPAMRKQARELGLVKVPVDRKTGIPKAFATFITIGAKKLPSEKS